MLTEPQESRRPTEMSFLLKKFFSTLLDREALTSLTRDSPRCKLPRVEIFPVPVKRDEVSSNAEISAIRFSFWKGRTRIEHWNKSVKRKKTRIGKTTMHRKSILQQILNEWMN